MRLPSDLSAWLGSRGPIVLGYSGGVDSTLLAVVGTEVLGPANLLAVIGRSESYPLSQWRAAVARARRHGVNCLEIDTRELADPSYRANAPDRCYFCKRELWSRLGRIREERGFRTTIDGTHVDDLREHRPGGRAGKEAGVLSPLAELGWGKARVREAARALGIAGWDTPAAPCLSSRIRYGLEVTAERLAQVERAEDYLRGLGIEGDLRVRHRGDHATIEITEAMTERLSQAWSEVEAEFLALGFARVERDPQGYRRGSLLPVAS
jgi:uncharacterized protein